MYDLEIDPRIGQKRKILSKLPGYPKKVNVERHLPLLMEAVGAEMRTKFGEGFNQP